MNLPAADRLLDALNAAAAALIALDPDGRRKLAQLRGKVVCLEIGAPAAKGPLRLYLLPTERGIEFRRDAQGAPDVTLSGSVAAFARLLRGAGEISPEDRVALHGDAELGQALQKILRQLDLDWEELLARRVGDAPARKLANAARALAGWAEKSLDLGRENAADYVREEKRLLVTPPAMERFAQTLNRTRADVDRLTRRVERVARALDQVEQNAPQTPPAQPAPGPPESRP